VVFWAALNWYFAEINVVSYAFLSLDGKHGKTSFATLTMQPRNLSRQSCPRSRFCPFATGFDLRAFTEERFRRIAVIQVAKLKCVGNPARGVFGASGQPAPADPQSARVNAHPASSALSNSFNRLPDRRIALIRVANLKCIGNPARGLFGASGQPAPTDPQSAV
jgi:hypothetical protein